MGYLDPLVESPRPEARDVAERGEELSLGTATATVGTAKKHRELTLRGFGVNYRVTDHP